MYEQVKKPKDDKSRVVANAVSQKKSDGKQGLGFVDNQIYGMTNRSVIQRVISNSNAKTVAQDVVDNHQAELNIEWTDPGLILAEALQESNYGVIAMALRARGYPKTSDNVNIVGRNVNTLLKPRKIIWRNPDQSTAVATDTALNNTINYNGTPYNTRNALIDQVYSQVGSKQNIGQALNRMDGGINVSQNTGINRAAGGEADAQTLSLQGALHCSFGMDQNGCTFFFTQTGTNITIVGLGFHVNNSNKQYRIVWSTAGYPTGRFDLP